MESIEFKNLKEISKNKIKKVLLINCKRKGYIPTSMPHVGLGILSGILKKRGHEVLVVDYLLAHNAPKISHFLEKFNPDIVGITAYSFNINEVKKKFDEIRNFSESLPIIVGGPHTSMFEEDLKYDKRLDYIVLRDGELLITEIVETAQRQKKPLVKEAKEFINLDNIPFPDYQSFYKWETIINYPIYTSRGCPHKCSYCSVGILCKRIWRARNPELCIEELKHAKKIFKKDLHVIVVDDSPSINKKRFIIFLKLNFKNNFNMRLDLYNVRADNITEELLILLKKTGAKSFAVAVEHIDSEVCELMNKAETVEQIENAIRLVKKHNFILTLFFVIGLPKDNLEKVKKCIKFAQKHKPTDTLWNIFQYTGPSTAVDWFKKNGKLDDFGETKFDMDKKSFYPVINPCAEYSGFSKYNIEKAYYMANLRTISPAFKLKDIKDIYKVISKYNLQRDFFYWIPRGFIKSLKLKLNIFNSVLFNLRKDGFVNTTKKIIYLKKMGRI